MCAISLYTELAEAHSLSNTLLLIGPLLVRGMLKSLTEVSINTAAFIYLFIYLSLTVSDHHETPPKH